MMLQSVDASSRKISVVAIDDEITLLDGLMFILKQEGMEFSGASTPEAFLKIVEDVKPDVTLNDLRLHGADHGFSGLELLPLVKRLSPRTHRIVFTQFASAATLIQAMKYKVEGFLEKGRTNGAQLVSAIRRVAQGEHVIDAEIYARMREIAHDSRRDPRTKRVLTARQRDVLRLVLQSNPTSRDIARCLNVGEECVRTHLKHASERLGVSGRFEMALEAQRLGLL
jgi:DNA-binding NarL/FixJ family response regulator